MSVAETLRHEAPAGAAEPAAPAAAAPAHAPPRLRD